MKLVPVDFSGGVNLLRDRRYIADNELTWAKNFVPTRSGLAGKRLPRGVLPVVTPPFGDVLPARGGVTKNLALHILDVSGMDFLAVHRNVVGTQSGGFRACTYNGDILDGANYSVLPAKRPQVVIFDHQAYVVSGYETYNQIVLLSSFATAQSGAIVRTDTSGNLEVVSLAFSGPQTVPVAPRLLASYRRRMVYADFGPGMEDWFIFSDFQQPTVISEEVLAANGRNYRLGGTPGRITAIREAMLTSTGSPTETVLLAFKERSMYIIQGQPGQSTDTDPGSGPNTILGDLVVQRVNSDAGCSSPETVVQTPYGLLWAGPDDVWILREGQTPQRVGTKIRPALQHTPADKRYLWHAAYFNGFYRLSIFSEGQGPSDDSPCGEQWWLDLRDGLDGPPRWWGPMIYKSVPGVALAAWAPNTAYLAGQNVSNEGNVYTAIAPGTSAASGGPTGTGFGIVDGTVAWDWAYPVPELTGVRMQVVDQRDGRAQQLLSSENNYTGGTYLYSYDVPGSAGRDGPALDDGFTGPLDPACMDGSEIEVELRTAESDLGDPGTDKVYAGVELSVASSEAVYMRAETSFDGGTRVITNDETMAQTGFVEDSGSLGQLDSALLTREFTAATIRPSALTRPRGITIQQTIKDVPGYIIDETCNRMSMYIEIDIGEYEFLVVTIPSGLYATISALADAVVAAFQAALDVSALAGVTISHNQTARTSPIFSMTVSNTVIAELNIWWGSILGVTTVNPVFAKLGSLLGFNTATSPVTSVTDTISATYPIFNKRSAHFELNNIIHDIIPMYRRPL